MQISRQLGNARELVETHGNIGLHDRESAWLDACVPAFTEGLASAGPFPCAREHQAILLKTYKVRSESQGPPMIG